MVKHLLSLIELISGLKLNVKNSVIFEVNTVLNRDLVLNVWGCKCGEFPTIYLGLPFGARFDCLRVWNPLLDKI